MRKKTKQTITETLELTAGKSTWCLPLQVLRGRIQDPSAAGVHPVLPHLNIIGSKSSFSLA